MTKARIPFYPSKRPSARPLVRPLVHSSVCLSARQLAHEVSSGDRPRHDLDTPRPAFVSVATDDEQLQLDMRDVAQALEAQGRATLLVTPASPPPRLRWRGTHVPLPLHKQWMWYRRANHRRLQALIDEHQLDIEHVWGEPPALGRSHPQSEGPSTPVRLITLTHGGGNGRTSAKSLTHPFPRGFFGRAFWRRLSAYDGIVVASQFQSDQLLAAANEHRANHSHLWEQRLQVIHPGVDIETFSVESVTPARLDSMAKTFASPDGVPVIFLPHDPHEPADLKLFLEALEVLRSTSELEFRALITDPGVSSEHSETLLRHHGLEGFVRFIEPQSDQPAAYMLSDIVPCPTAVPPWRAQRLVEAMAMARIVIASDHGAAAEILSDKQNQCWRVPPHSADALAAALHQALLLSNAKRKEISQRHLETILQRFTREACCNAYLSLYDRLTQDCSGDISGSRAQDPVAFDDNDRAS